jgi:hypothetical protein
MLHTKLPRNLRSISLSLALLLEFRFYFSYQQYWIDESVLDYGITHFQHYYPDERARASGSIRPTTMGFLAKAHQVHAAMNNHEEEHRSIVLETSGTIVDQSLSIC